MRRTLARSAGRIAAIYVVIAILWIVFSDHWVARIFGGTELLSDAQTLKGWAFVLFTGVLLYGLMARAMRSIDVAAFGDAVSGLPNRRAFLSELGWRCDSCSDHQAFCISILDLDHFTDVNDEQGHEQGDALLKLVGEALVRELDSRWYLARLGGDEFGLLSPVNDEPSRVLATLDVLQRNLTRNSDNPLLRGQKVSIGSCEFPAQGKNRHDLVRHADMALSCAKASGRNRHYVYQDRFKHEAITRIALLKDLRSACASEAFEVVYQPQWSHADQRWVGAEVLARWTHPKRGVVSPDVFIPLAEREGLIVAITETVMDKALRELAQAGIGRSLLPSLSFNLSQHVLLHEDVMARLFERIGEQRDEGPEVVMEITETAAMEDIDGTLSALHYWRGRGIKFAIDDFGTGYSSLARLKQMPISELKVDRSFVKGIPDDQDDAMITKAILAMAQALSLKVVAEGVETLEQADYLKAHGCCIQQGYLFARPMPIDGLKKRLL